MPTIKPHPETTQAVIAPSTLSGSAQKIADDAQAAKAAKSNTGHLSGRSRAEENDDYPVVAALNPAWRVIACKHSLQWILQHRRGGPDSWRGEWFCRTREALVRGVRMHTGDAGLLPGDALVVLLRLPEILPSKGPEDVDDSSTLVPMESAS
jgi:hypothetical protein